MQVECRTGDENVQPEPEHADRLALADLADRRIGDVGRIDDGHSAAALDLDRLVRSDEGGRVFIETDADGKRIVRQRRDQTPQAIALPEVLIDDEAIRETEARREAHAARDDGGALVAERDHVLAQEAGPRAGPADRDAVRIAYANELGDRRAAEQRREPQLVPAGKEDSGRRLEPPQAAGFLAVAARIEIHHRHPRGAQVREEFLVPGPRLVHPTGCGDDDDIRVGAARDAYEAFQNMA